MPDRNWNFDIKICKSCGAITYPPGTCDECKESIRKEVEKHKGKEPR